MIVTRNNAYALGLNGEAVTFVSEFDMEAPSSADLKKAIWTITKSGNNIRWQNAHDTSQYLRLQSQRDERTIFNDGSGASIVVNYRNRANDVAYFNVGGNNWLTYNNGFGISRQNNYSDNADYRFLIYRIDRSGESWGTAFNLRDEISEFCVVTDSNGNLITLGGTNAVDAEVVTMDLEDEVVDTAATDSTEAATEPTEATEAATEPAEVATEPAAPAEPAEPAESAEPSSGEA